MKLDISFRVPRDRNDLTALTYFLLAQDLGYPRYGDWVGRTGQQIESGDKEAVLGFNGYELVSCCIYQPHKEIPRFVEVKNLRVAEGFRTRYFGRFLLRQVEYAARGKYDALIGDVRPTKIEIVKFLEDYGFQRLCFYSLYERGVPDLVMVKWINPAKRNVLAPLAENRIVAAAL
jgi:ribosomal protein S18 acetylase RimI-like enzyme